MGQKTNKIAPYPEFSRPERIADATIHIIGIAASIAAVAILLGLMHGRLAPAHLIAVIVYSGTLVAMLTFSGLYHLAAHTAARPFLRRLDHAAIYLKIAGTFTPLAVLLGSLTGYLILGAVWLVALIGAARKLLARRGQLPSNALPYVALGWIGAMLLVPLTQIAPLPALILLAAGGLTYTAGVLFYSWESLRFATAIWHGFVLVASSLFFAGIATSVVALS